MVDPLVDELLINKVAYIAPIRELLKPHAAALAERLQAMLRDPQLETKRRFRAGVALAGFMDTASTWEDQDLQFLATQLITENAEYQPVLRDNLRPIAVKLLSSLETLFKDAQLADAMRLGAANAVADFAANQPELLTRLLADATPKQYEVLYALVEKDKSTAGIAELKQITAAFPPDEMGSVDRIGFGQRRANAAVSLLRLGERDAVLPVFDWTDDPEALTQFIFRCKPRGIGVETLLDLLEIVTRRVSEGPSSTSTNPNPTQSLADASGWDRAKARYALLLTIGEYAPTEIPSARREALVKQLADWYANDPSSGVHGAAGWLLRHLGENEIVTRVDQTPVPYSPDREWFTLAITVRPTPPPTPKPEDKQERPEESASKGEESDAEKTDSEIADTEPETPEESPEPIPPKTFYYTFIVIPPGESTIGCPQDEPERSKDNVREVRHIVKLTRPFALLDREITWEELSEFKPLYAIYMQQSASSPEAAGHGVHWYDSVGFCRWLGEKIGLPESDQAYVSPESLDKEKYPREPNPSANWAPRDWPIDLHRRGFRLPTDAEWEVATRAGSRTAYGFGGDALLLERFGWFVENSGKQMHPSKVLRPSTRGLFDLHGNLYEWTHDLYRVYGAESVTDPVVSAGGLLRGLRGGGWDSSAAICRAAYRNSYGPASRTVNGGFRLALSPSSQVPAERVQVAEPSGVGTEGAGKEEEGRGK